MQSIAHGRRCSSVVVAPPGQGFSPEQALLCLSHLPVNAGVTMAGMKWVKVVFRFLGFAQGPPPQPGWHCSYQKPNVEVGVTWDGHQ